MFGLSRRSPVPFCSWFLGRATTLRTVKRASSTDGGRPTFSGIRPLGISPVSRLSKILLRTSIGFLREHSPTIIKSDLLSELPARLSLGPSSPLPNLVIQVDRSSSIHRGLGDFQTNVLLHISRGLGNEPQSLLPFFLRSLSLSLRRFLGH